MLIYFLIFPGLKIIIAGNTQRLARNHKKLQTVVLAVPPWVKEVNRDNPKNETKSLDKFECLLDAARGVQIFQPITEIASTECRCLELTWHTISLNVTVKKKWEEVLSLCGRRFVVHNKSFKNIISNYDEGGNHFRFGLDKRLALILQCMEH